MIGHRVITNEQSLKVLGSAQAVCLDCYWSGRIRESVALLELDAVNHNADTGGQRRLFDPVGGGSYAIGEF